MNLSFLKKVGTIVVKGAAIAAGLQPLIAGSAPASAQPTVSTVIGDLQQVAGVITTVESIGQITGMVGSEKLRAATPLVAQAILQSQMMVGQKIKDQALFTAGAQKIADGMADVLNSLHEDGVQEIPKTA